MPVALARGGCLQLIIFKVPQLARVAGLWPVELALPSCKGETVKERAGREQTGARARAAGAALGPRPVEVAEVEVTQ